MPPENSVQNRPHKSFFQTDFVKMGSAVLATLLAVYLFNGFTKQESVLSISHSEDISTNDMSDLFDQYIKFKPLDLMYNDPQESQNHVYSKLHGFRYKASDLDSILHNNRIKDNAGNSVIPDEVIFYLGQQGTWKDGRLFPQTHGNIHIIAVGIKNRQLLIPASSVDRADKKKSSIYDKADPCPGTGCPSPPPPPPAN